MLSHNSWPLAKLGKADGSWESRNIWRVPIALAAPVYDSSIGSLLRLLMAVQDLLLSSDSELATDS